MIILKNILVATDFSEPSAKALAYGRDLARSYNAALHILHVTEDVMRHYSPEVGFAVPDLQKDLDRAARRELDLLITADDVQASDGHPRTRDGRQSGRGDHGLRESPRDRSDHCRYASGEAR